MIYLVEDDNNIRELVVYTLNHMKLTTEGFDKPSDFRKAMEKSRPDLILLDIMLPEEDGLSILRDIRSNSLTARIPVIMLTAKAEEYDKVKGLESGADDYISKPFGMMELVARVKAVLRRSDYNNMPSDENAWMDYNVGDLYVNPAKHVVQVDGNVINLTVKEYDMLCMLLAHRGTVLSRDRLLTNIWGYSFDGANRTVDVHIRTLRQKLGKAGDCITTIRGVGYRID